MTQAKFSPELYALTRPLFGGTLWAALKLKQIYYCAAPHCPKRKKRVESWLTVADGARLLEGGGLRCQHCHGPLKWLRTEPLHGREGS